MADTDITEPWFPVEETLKNDSSGAKRDALINRLNEQAKKLKRQMDAGVPQREFAQLSSVHLAFEVASQLVTVIWNRYHRIQ